MLRNKKKSKKKINLGSILCDKTFHLCKKVNNNNLTHQQRMRCTQGSHLWSCNGFVTLWLIDWIGLEVDLHMHMYCRGCTCISYWAWTWAWDWAPLSRSCRGQCRCTSALTATIYCSPNNTLVKIPNPGNSRYTDYFSVYRLRWQPCSYVQLLYKWFSCAVLILVQIGHIWLYNCGQ